MKLLVNGYGRHGKDTFCELIWGVFPSSSWVLLTNVIWPNWGKFHYETMQECFDRRHDDKGREIWYKLCVDYNTPDKTKLTRDVMNQCNVYCGMRSIDEFNMCKKTGMFDLTVWIDASDRLQPENSSSCTVRPQDHDLIITNNGTLEEFKTKALRFKQALGIRS